MNNEETIIDAIKYKSHNDFNYMPGLKIITNESIEYIMRTFKHDLSQYNQLCRYIVRGNMIEIGLCTNATPTIYYFLNTENFEEVKKELKKFCEANDLGFLEL